MIGQTLPEYIFILLSIGGLRAIAPISISYFIGRIVNAWTISHYGTGFVNRWWWLWIVEFYAILEALFYLGVYLPRKWRLQQPSVTKPRLLSHAERKSLFHQCQHSISDIHYPLGWFFSTDIKRDNVREWLLWALFFSAPHEAKPEWEEEIADYIARIERQLDRRFEPGKVDQTLSMRLSYDRVRMHHRPLLWYIIVFFVDCFTSIRLMLLGFHHYVPRKYFQVFPPRPLTILFSKPSTTDNFAYWYRPHRNSDTKPIIFIHGIGIGLYPYVDLMKDILATSPNTGILCIEIMPISMHITCSSLQVPNRAVMLKAIERVMNKHGIDQATLVGHSYGTVISSWILRSANAHAIGISEDGESEDTELEYNDEERYQDDPLIPIEQGQASTTEPTSTPTYSRTRRARIPLHKRFTSTLLIDPIPILLNLPDVAFNFLYRSPARHFRYEAPNPWWTGWNGNEWQLWFFASRDADVGRLLSRDFWWHECILWKEDLLPPQSSSDLLLLDDHPSSSQRHTSSSDHNPSSLTNSSHPHQPWKGNVSILLSGSDQIINSTALWRYLTGEESSGPLSAPCGDGQYQPQPAEHATKAQSTNPTCPNWRWRSHLNLYRPSEDAGITASKDTPVKDTTNTPISASGSNVPQSSEENGLDLSSEDMSSSKMVKDIPSNTLEVIFCPGLDHATVFDRKDRRQVLVNVIERFGRST